MAEAILAASGIYAITNTINGKKYIGSAVNLRRRYKKHIAGLANSTHHNAKLQRAWQKYGESAFLFSVIEIVEDRNNLIAREQFWIDEHNAVETGYNVSPTAGSILGVKRSQETIEKMRLAGLKYVASTETREKLRKANTGKKASPEKLEKMRALVKSPETLEKLRIAGTGRKMSEDAVQKVIARHLGSKRSEETKEKMRQAKLGKKQDPEHVAKRTAKIRGRKQSPEEIANRIAIRLANKIARQQAKQI